MTNKQPEALRLAEILESYYAGYNHTNTAAAELRRLHEVNAELVEALKDIIDAERSAGRSTQGFVPRPATRAHQLRVYLAWQKAHAAIAKAAGEQQ